MLVVKMPELGEEIEKAVVSYFYVKVGDQVKKEDDILELTTDKATFNVSTAAAGLIKNILVKEGQEVKIGQDLVVIE